MVGTAHALQGDEKDIVIFTTSIDPDSHPASLRFLENPNLFNVAITRARKQQYVVTSVHAHQLPAGLLRDYLHYSSDLWQPDFGVSEGQSEFEKQVIQQLQQQQMATWPGFEAAGVRIHIVVSDGQRHLAVLCDGFQHHAVEPVDALTTHRLLARAGWQLRRIPHRTWQQDWFACCDAIRNGLDHGRSN